MERACNNCGQSLPAFVQRCPRCSRERGEAADGAEPLKPTLLESVTLKKDVRSSAASPDDVVPYRPVMRPRRAALCILDDGALDGEWIRIRTGRLTIGRTEGDVVIPDDDGISGRHVEIVRRVEGGYHRWYLRDLGSRNGTFVKVSKARLTDGLIILLGLRRFRFELPKQAAPAAEGERQTTRGWDLRAVRGELIAPPKLIEMNAVAAPLEICFTSNDFTIGSDQTKATQRISDDPTVSPIHARVVQDEAGRWSIENQKSLNGVWCQTDEVGVDDDCVFQLGEQQFLLRVQR